MHNLLCLLYDYDYGMTIQITVFLYFVYICLLIKKARHWLLSLCFVLSAVCNTVQLQSSDITPVAKGCVNFVI